MKTEHRRAHSAYPPRSQAIHHQRAISKSGDYAKHASQACEHQTFAQKQRANLCGRKSQCLKSSDFAQALFDAKLEKQAGQQERRDDEKKAEVDEVLSEISGPVRRFEPFDSRRINQETRLASDRSPRAISACTFRDTIDAVRSAAIEAK